MNSYVGENVIEHAAEAFAETVALKVKQLRRFIPKEKARTNTDVTGTFIEELVRGFIRTWIGGQRMVTGAFYSKQCERSKDKAMQIDGIVHDPRRGPAIIAEGDFEIVHPAFCSGVVEIKMTQEDTQSFEQRLRLISGRYMSHLTSSAVMGVIIAARDPVKQSVIPLRNGSHHYLYNYRLAGWCPIFILFQEKDGEYTPFMDAIDALIRACHELVVTTNFL